MEMVLIVVLILAGNSEIGAHAGNEIGNLICLSLDRERSQILNTF